MSYVLTAINDRLAQIERDDSNAQVVAKIAGRDVTRGELSVAFDRVADPSNWKNPINAIVATTDLVELALILEAVRFFTGSIPTFKPVRKGSRSYRVRAAGYYRTIGA